MLHMEGTPNTFESGGPNITLKHVTADRNCITLLTSPLEPYRPVCRLEWGHVSGSHGRV